MRRSLNSQAGKWPHPWCRRSTARIAVWIQLSVISSQCLASDGALPNTRAYAKQSRSRTRNHCCGLPRTLNDLPGFGETVTQTSRGCTPERSCHGAAENSGAPTLGRRPCGASLVPRYARPEPLRAAAEASPPSWAACRRYRAGDSACRAVTGKQRLALTGKELHIFRLRLARAAGRAAENPRGLHAREEYSVIRGRASKCSVHLARCQLWSMADKISPVWTSAHQKRHQIPAAAWR